MQDIMTIQDWKETLRPLLGKNVSKEFIMAFSNVMPTNFYNEKGETTLDIIPGVFFPKIEHRMDSYFIKDIHKAFYKEKKKEEYASKRAAEHLRKIFIYKALVYFLNFETQNEEFILEKEEIDFLEKRIKIYQPF